AWGLFAMMEEDTFDAVSEFLVKEDVRIEPDFVYRWQLASRKREEREYEDFVTFSDPRLSYIPEVTRTRNMRSWQVYRRLNAQQLRELEEGYDKFQKFLHYFVKAGGKIDLGTDTSEGRMAGKGAHREFEFLVDVGFSPRDVIVWATKGSAEFLGRDDELGTVEAGKVADVIVVDGDPLTDITSIKNIETVIKSGEIIDVGYHPDYTNPIPRPFQSSLHSYPIPKISRMSPGITVEGGDDVTLEIEGEGFVRGSVVEFGDARIATEIASAKEIRARIPRYLLNRAGTFMVTVVNPKPVAIKDPLHENERSNPKYFMVKFR
ncbi:MAG: amidohydrolase family protein, partial [Deltaproteobacteria bacterium]|nr:amidohydrolase family protein [Deltaproteobacteria bacterium]